MKTACGLSGVALALFLAAGLYGCAGKGAGSGEEGLELVLLHSNDTHACLAGVDRYGNASLDGKESRGGLGRMAAAMKAKLAGRDNVLVLDAGDQFQGTLFYSVNKWPMIAEVERAVPWDAMTLGNHEFDEGCAELARFLEKTPVPVLAANLEPQEGCPLAGVPVRARLVRNVRGEKVGVVGLANDEAATLAGACPQTRFADAAATLKKQVRELEAEGVKHIVAVTHLGLPADRALAREVDGVDVIVGGHTHSHLGPAPSDGPYPIVEHSPDGSPVLVVTAGRSAQHLGELTVRFDAAGVPAAWSGGALPLTADMPVDADMAAQVDRWAATLENLRGEVVGFQNLSLPDGMEACREGDCLGGMVTVDAMLEFSRPFGAVVALCNGGAIRAALPAGKLTRGDVLSVHPFGNVNVLREYGGRELLAALEHGVEQEGAKGPRILQAAGLRYGVDATRPAGERVLFAEIVDESGMTRPLEPDGRYVVALADYLAGGGDGYAMLERGREVPSPEALVADVVEGYLRAHSPLKKPQDGRIVRMDAPAGSGQATPVH